MRGIITEEGRIKTRRKLAKCRQCSSMRDCKTWTKEINKVDPSTYEKVWETCGRFKSDSYQEESEGERYAYYSNGVY